MAQNNLPTQDAGGNIAAILNKSIPAFKLALPKSMDPERMARIALTTIRRSDALLRCNPMSLAGAVLESASLGLEIDSRGLAYLVPYKGNITLIVGYKGLMQLAYRSGKLNNIYADVVYRKEVEAGRVAVTLGAERSLRHDFDILASGPLRTEADDNPIVLSYAVAVFKDGSKHFEFITDSELQKRKKASASGGKGFLWNKNDKGISWIEEGWKKTAIRKLCKYMDLSPEIQRAVAIDEQADHEGGKRQNFDFAGTIDVDFSTNGVSEEEVAYDIAPFNEAMTAHGISPEDIHLASFVRLAADQARIPVDRVKAEASGDVEGFVAGFKKWLEAKRPNDEAGQAKKGQGKKPTDAPPAPEADAETGYFVTCPNTDKSVNEEDCAAKPCRPDCPAFE